MMEKLIGGIIIGEQPSAEEALKHVKRMKNCPYLIASGTSQNKIYSVFIVPEDKRWWLKYPEMDPRSTGMGKVQVFLMENLIYPEKFVFKTPEQKTTISPCGENCELCQLRLEYHCRGCPATIHYGE